MEMEMAEQPMPSHQSKPKVGILGLSLEFYETLGPEIRIGREAFVRDKLLPALSPHMDVRFDGAVYRRQDVERTVRQYEAAGMDVLLVVLLTYSPSLISAPALSRTSLPVVVWNTQELFAVDESYDQQKLVDNHGVHGTHDLCNVLVRYGRAFLYGTGHLDCPTDTESLKRRIRCAYAVSRLRRARLGLLGYPFPGMGDFGLDTTFLAGSLGCSWQALGVADYVKRSAAAPARDVAELVEQYCDDYHVADDITDDDLGQAARAELALRGMVTDFGLDAYSYQFLAFGEDERVETLPFVAASRLMAEGIGFGGEGDLISAAHCAMLNWLSPPASFSEIFTIDFAGNSVLLSHMGESNVAMAAKGAKPALVKRAKSLVPVRGSQLAIAAGFAPGEATLSALTLSAGQKWRIIAARGSILEFGPLTQLAVPHAKFQPAGELRTFLDNYAKAGGPHHLAISFGDNLTALEEAAALLGAEYVQVG
jgi:L-arabinose isomerase